MCINVVLLDSPDLLLLLDILSVPCLPWCRGHPKDNSSEVRGQPHKAELKLRISARTQNENLKIKRKIDLLAFSFLPDLLRILSLLWFHLVPSVPANTKRRDSSVLRNPPVYINADWLYQHILITSHYIYLLQYFWWMFCLLLCVYIYIQYMLGLNLGTNPR